MMALAIVMAFAWTRPWPNSSKAASTLARTVPNGAVTVKPAARSPERYDRRSPDRAAHHDRETATTGAPVRVARSRARIGDGVDRIGGRANRPSGRSDAQDWEIAQLKIATQMDGADKASATVSFANFDE